MPKFKLIIEDVQQYGCTVEAETQDEAVSKFKATAMETGDLYEATLKFSDTRTYDGYVESNWYDADPHSPLAPPNPPKTMSQRLVNYESESRVCENYRERATRRMYGGKDSENLVD